MLSIETEPGPFSNKDTFPRLWTWPELKDVVDSGRVFEAAPLIHALNLTCRDLKNLKRHPLFQKAYDEASEELVAKYGSVAHYLVAIRLQWNLQHPIVSEGVVGKKDYFTADINEDLVRVVVNDWPYSVPDGVVHYLVWSRLPFIHSKSIDPKIADKVLHDGLWGFSGNGRTARFAGPYEDVTLIRQACAEIDTFVKRIWRERDWETAWFINPPRLQSVPELAHFHVFARRKLEDGVIPGEGFANGIASRLE